MKEVIGHIIDNSDDRWRVICPECGDDFIHEGYFDPDDITTCDCGCKFQTKRIEFENGDYIL
jgi:hypothetical protein